MSDITERVQRIIEEKLGVDASEVKPEATFTNDLGADSLDTVELIMELLSYRNIRSVRNFSPHKQTVCGILMHRNE